MSVSAPPDADFAFAEASLTDNPIRSTVVHNPWNPAFAYESTGLCNRWHLRVLVAFVLVGWGVVGTSLYQQKLYEKFLGDTKPVYVVPNASLWKQAQTFVERNFPEHQLEYNVPLIVVVSSHLGSAGNADVVSSLEVLRFSWAFAKQLAPCGSCIYRESNKGCFIHSVRGLHLSEASDLRRGRYLHARNTSTTFQVNMCLGAGDSLLDSVNALYTRVQNEVIPHAVAATPGFAEKFQATVVEVSGFLLETKDLAVQDFAFGDAIAVPIAVVILVLFLGPLALIVCITIPLTVMLAFSIVDVFFVPDYVFAPFSPAIFVSLAFAMSLDYCLFLVSRFREICLATSLEAPTDMKEFGLSAISVSFQHAGAAIFVSGILLVVAFFCITVVEDDLCKTIGFGGSVTVGCCIITSLTIIPAVLMLFVDCCPISLIHTARSCTWLHSMSKSTNRASRSVHFVEMVEPDAMNRACSDGSQELLPITRIRDVGDREDLFHLARFSGISSGISERKSIAVKYPRAVLVVAVIATAPMAWVASYMRVTSSIMPIIPRTSSMTQRLQALDDTERAGMLLPIIIALQASDHQPTCQDLDAQLSATIEYYLPPGVAASSNWTCAVLDQLQVCGEEPKLIGVDSSIVKRIVQVYCPITCNKPCATNQNAVLADSFFEALKSLHAVVQDAIREMSPAPVQSHSVDPWVVQHLAAVGDFPVSAKTAREYVLNGTRGAEADSYRLWFSELASLDGTSALMRVELPFSGIDDRANRIVPKLREVVAKQVSQPGCPVKGWAIAADVEQAQAGVDLVLVGIPKMCITALAAVLLLTALFFKSLCVPVRMVFTILLTLLWAFGALVIIFEWFLGEPGIYWIIPPCLTPLLAGLTLDYDAFLIMRIMELRLEGESTPRAVSGALKATSAVISVAGVIMAVAFSALCFSSLRTLQEFGALLLIGSIFDTFVVRPLVVPALILCLGDPENNWWPRKMPPVTRPNEY